MPKLASSPWLTIILQSPIRILSLFYVKHYFFVYYILTIVFTSNLLFLSPFAISTITTNYHYYIYYYYHYVTLPTATKALPRISKYYYCGKFRVDSIQLHFFLLPFWFLFGYRVSNVEIVDGSRDDANRRSFYDGKRVKY